MEHRCHQPLAFSVDVELTGRRHDLAGDGGEDRVELAAIEGEVERQLQEQVGAVGDAVAPPFAGIEAAVVGERRQVGRPREHELGALRIAEEGLDAIGARDLGEGERGERLGEPVRVGVRKQARQQGRPDRLQRRRRQRLGASPMRDGVVGDAVAQLGVRRSQAVEQGEGERLARVVVGDLPFDLLEDLQRELGRRAGRTRCAGHPGGDQTEHGGDAPR